MFKNARKCKLTFERIKLSYPQPIGDQPLTIVKSYKLLGMWFNDDLKWRTNTEHITKKGAKRLYLLKILKSYNAPNEALKTFYVAVIRSVLEYVDQVWTGNLTKEQVKDIDKIQKKR